MIEWSQEIVDFIKDYHDKNYQWLDRFANYPSGHLGMVKQDGALELYDGRLRAIDAQGHIILNDVPTDDYTRYFTEAVEKWSYMKFPYLADRGRETGWNRVGPLARLNVCHHITTPRANAELKIFKDYTSGRPNHGTMHYHWARLIEILYCAEEMKNLLTDESILGTDLLREGQRRPEGIGIIEAPRGTLIHHYRVDDKGMITKCNLIVSTTHNNEAMNRAVRWVAKNTLDRQEEITESMLNQVEVAIRAFDPCLSCATHALGKMPLNISVFDHAGNLVQEKTKS